MIFPVSKCNNFIRYTSNAYECETCFLKFYYVNYFRPRNTAIDFVILYASLTVDSQWEFLINGSVITVILINVFHMFFCYDVILMNFILNPLFECYAILYNTIYCIFMILIIFENIHSLIFIHWYSLISIQVHVQFKNKFSRH